MPESVYKIIELVGTSTESWQKAATAAVEAASKSLKELRISRNCGIRHADRRRKCTCIQSKGKSLFQIPTKIIHYQSILQIEKNGFIRGGGIHNSSSPKKSEDIWPGMTILGNKDSH